jgi:hypothetical protein
MRLWIAVAAVLIAGCVSTQMRGYVGRDITEAMLAYGQPVQTLDLPDGRRAFQFRYGGGTAIIPAQGYARATTAANTTSVSSTSTPAVLVDRPGCLLTFIAKPAGSSWTVVETRTPKELVC